MEQSKASDTIGIEDEHVDENTDGNTVENDTAPSEIEIEIDSF